MLDQNTYLCFLVAVSTHIGMPFIVALTSSATEYMVLQKHGCVIPSSLSSSMTFTPVGSSTQCAVLCHAPSCAGVAINDNGTSGKQCALLSQYDIPVPSVCGSDAAASVTIYKDVNVEISVPTTVPTTISTTVQTTGPTITLSGKLLF